MHRFFAVVGTPPSDQARKVHAEVVRRIRSQGELWTSVFQVDGLTVWRSGSSLAGNRLYSLGNTGVALGTLFRKHSVEHPSEAIFRMADSEVEDISETLGRCVADKYWGRYVLFVRPEKRTVLILRDPAGAQPCYYARCGQLYFVFSHFADLLELAPLHLTANLAHVAACLQLHFFAPSCATGFNEVQALLAGECLTVRDSVIERSFYWNAPQLCRSSESESIDIRGGRLRRIVSATVQSWGSCYTRILHELSGGLDSSIVLACLLEAQRPPQVTCCNYYTDDREGDERQFARSMASHVQAPLEEIPLQNQPRTCIEQFVKADATPTPLLAQFRCEDDTARPMLVKKYSSEAITSGQGGDQMFYRGLRALHVADYMHDHGVGSSLLRALVDAARAGKQPIWRILIQAIRYGLLRRPHDAFSGAPSPSFILARDLNPTSQIHPWVAEATSLPPAKAIHLMYVLEAQTLWNRQCTYADEIYPLTSQPIIEFTLGIPTYVLSHGAMDRALVRRAFESCLPARIVTRSSKGAVNRHFFRVIHDNRLMVREFLLDGELSAAGLIDRAALDRALTHPPEVAKGHYLFPIVTACKCEMWLREARSLHHANTHQAIPTSVSSHGPELAQI